MRLILWINEGLMWGQVTGIRDFWTNGKLMRVYEREMVYWGAVIEFTASILYSIVYIVEISLLHDKGNKQELYDDLLLRNSIEVAQ